MNKLLQIIGVLTLSVFSILLKTWILLYGYVNGLVPLGLPIIGYWHALGLIMFISVIAMDTADLRAAEKDGAEQKGMYRIISSLTIYLFAWLTFWLVF